MDQQIDIDQPRLFVNDPIQIRENRSDFDERHQFPDQPEIFETVETKAWDREV